MAILTEDGRPFRGDHSPGQAVSGLVRVSMEGEPRKCRGVRLDIYGVGRVEWDGDEEGAETYVNHRQEPMRLSHTVFSNFGFDKTNPILS